MIAGAAGAAGGGGGFYDHQIANSVRVPATSSTSSSNGRLTRTFSTVDSNVHFTLNFWIKRSAIEGSNPVSSARPLTFFTPRLSTSGSVLQEFMFSATGSYGAGDAFAITNTNTGAYVLSTNNLFRDTSAWYNFHIQADLDNGSASEKLKIFINGTEASYNVDNRGSFTSLAGIAAGAWTIGDYYGYGYPIQSYLAQWAYVDGYTHPPTDFAESKNGVWIPKDLSSGITWGSAGHLLMFQDSSALGDDTSGKGNDWATANISTHDQMLDSPTFGSSSSGNFCTWNPLLFNAQSLSEGNCRFDGQTNNRSAYGNFGLAIGSKYYVEFLVVIATNYGFNMGISSPPFNPLSSQYGDSTAFGWEINASSSSNWFTQSMTAGTRGSASSNIGQDTTRVMAITVDRVNHQIKCYLDNVLTYTIAISATAEFSFYSGFSGGSNANLRNNINAGQDSTGGGDFSAGSATDENGFGSFQYAPPTGFLALCSANLPVADAVDPAQTDDNYPQKLFSATIWTGNGSGRTISSGSKSDAVWIKRRNGAASWAVQDSTRGTSAALEFNTAATEDTSFTQGVTAFGSSSFNIGTQSQVNNNSDTYVGYAIGANGGTTSSNGNGSVTSTVQTDPSGAFSIVTWAGSGGAATIGHGLSGAPSFMVAKSRTSSATVEDWVAFHKNMNNGAYPANESRMYLNSTGGYSTGALWQNDNNSSTVFGVTSNISNSSKNYVAYCFTDVEGYCKADYYVGNGESSDNAFVYLGFRPAWIMIKGLASGAGWNIHDNATSPINLASTALQANTSGAELSNYNIDMLSNGFKVRDGDGDLGTNGNKYIYLAMAKNPFKYSLAR